MPSTPPKPPVQTILSPRKSPRAPLTSASVPSEVVERTLQSPSSSPNLRVPQATVEAAPPPITVQTTGEGDTGQCAHCGEAVEANDVVESQGGVFHSRCFTCSCCLLPLGSFFLRDGQLLCPGDFTRLGSSEAVKCAGCGSEISSQEVLQDGVVDVMSRRWHVGCFACSQCGVKALEDVEFEVSELADGTASVRCEKCF